MYMACMVIIYVVEYRGTVDSGESDFYPDATCWYVKWIMYRCMLFTFTLFQLTIALK